MFCIVITTRTQGELSGKSFFSPRSQSVNAARELVGWHRYIHQFDADTFYGSCSIAPEYLQSYRPQRVAEYFFNTDTLTISGSQVTNRDNTTNILADYFGLSPAFGSTVTVVPKVQQALVDFNCYIGFNNWYFRIHAPAVWTKWELKLEEIPNNNGSDTPFPALYMAQEALQAPVQSFNDAIKGNVTFGDVQDGLQFGKIDNAQTKGGLSDIQAALGYNFVVSENGHVGLNIRGSAPTGTRPTSEFLFEPVIGNGKHWELGVGFTGEVIIWERDGDQTVSLFVDANITHLFPARQNRSFDFTTNGFGSRYILLKQFDNTGNYDGLSLPAINKTTLSCKVKTSVQIDIAIMFGYIYNEFGFDIGYNGWARSRERISLKESIESNRFGFKGIQNVAIESGDNDNTTQSTATLNGNNFENQLLVADASSPVFINTQDLDVTSAASPRAITHKIFAHFSYTWENKQTKPYLGVGGEVEFEGVRPKDSQPNKNTLSQWGVWLKGGLGF